jgi:beta-glucosidase
MHRMLRPRSTRVLLIAVALAASSDARAQRAPAYDPRVEALLERMTLEEKVGEMTQLTLTAITRTAGTATRTHELDSAKLENAIVRNHVGSVLNVADVAFTAEHWHHVITTIQRAAQRTRLRIPVLYGIDAVHGHNYLLGATIFPQNLAMAATWNPELLRRSNEITAIEMRATGIRWNFSPVLDLGRQPAWSRFFETFGEDVYLASTMGVAAVRGLQGNAGVQGSVPVAATGKHFLGYSMPRTGRDRTPAWIPDRMLYELFVPPFRVAIDAGIRSIMVNSADVNLVPVHSSRELLTDLLRKQLGFDGVIVSDWEDINRLHTVHHVAESPKSAVRMAILAGVDMSMVPYDVSFATYLIELVREGSISEGRIEESVRRILKLKFDTGLFDNPFPDYGSLGRIGMPEFQAVSRQAAEEAVTLLENRSSILPLDRKTRVLLTGPGAQSLPAAHGGWTYSWQGTNDALYPRSASTLHQALLARLGPAGVTYVPGTAYEKEIDIAAAANAARRADVAVIALAERPSTEKPGDIEDLELPEPQLRLAHAIQATGTPTVLVLMENRPRIVRSVVDSARAVLLAYQSGPYTGDAVVDILLGTVNPSGRLPFTYPRYANSLLHYDHTYSEEIGPNAPDGGYNPQWPFGYGLSFTTFEYDNVRVLPELARARDTLTISVRVTNTGKRAGKEVVQLYVRDLYATIAPPVRRLRGFEKIRLAPGETRVVTFRLPVSDLAFIGRDHRPVIEPGRFDVLIGPLEQAFEVR